MKSVLIAGGGLFGRIIALHLNDLGHPVTVVSKDLPESGLSAAGCLMKPSWTSKVARRQEGLEMLDRLVGVREVPFKIFNPVNVFMEDCWALDKDQLLNHEAFHAGGGIAWVNEEIFGIGHENRTVHTRDFAYEADVLIECMGSWSQFAKTRFGVSFEHTGEFPGRIKPWRPFTQLVGFNIAPNRVWAGDGTALTSMSEQDVSVSRSRVEKFTGVAAEKIIVGRRPYSREKVSTPCHVFEHGKSIVVTGGAKNGTIGAAWAALEIGDMLG